MNPYATHQSLLIAVATIAPQNILECGMGNFSTPILLNIVKKYNGKLTSCESDNGWRQKFKHLECEHFQSFHMPIWKNAIQSHEVFQKEYSLLFIDSHNWQSRLDILTAMKNKCQYIILHDSMHLTKEYRDFKYMQEVGPGLPDNPSTLVMSNFNECNFTI